MSFLRTTFLSMEDAMAGISQQELEHAFYVKIDNFDLLSNATEKQRIEQASFYTENKGKGSLMMRSRKINYMASADKQGLEEIIFCTKTPNTGTAGAAQMMEVELPGSKEQHALYMQFGSAIFKDRYRFAVVGTTLFWDVDVFLNKDGSYSNWARLEVEVKDLNAPVPEFPFAVQDSFSADDNERRDALRKAGLVQQ